MTHPDPEALDLQDDDTLSSLLAAALEVEDPVPDIARQVAVAAFDLGHLEGELAAVVADSAVDAPVLGARHDGIDDRYVELEAPHLRVELDLPAGQALLLGQIDPPGAEHVIVEFASAAGGVERVEAAVDDLGRFQVELRPGSLRMHFAADGGPVVTPWIVR